MSGRRIAACLDRLSAADAEDALRRCCASSRWVRRMMAGRPYADDAALLEAADAAWWDLAPDDWRQAFAAHPRIGERSEGWSADEQAGMGGASPGLRESIRAGNRAYEEKFGHVFLVCATGLTAAEMAAALSERLERDPGTELRTAAAEQAKITRLRLQKLGTE